MYAIYENKREFKHTSTLKGVGIMKNVKNMFIGIFLTIIGFAMLLQKLTFSDPSNKGMLGDIMGGLFGQTSPQAVSGVLFVVVFICLLLMVFATNIVTVSLFVMSLIATALIIVGSMDVSIATMSGLEVGITVGMVIVGIGLAGRSVVKMVCVNGNA